MSSKKLLQKALAGTLVLALVLAMVPVTGVSAKAKKPTLSKSAVTLDQGKTTKLSVKKNGTVITSVKWKKNGPISLKKASAVSAKVTADTEGIGVVKATVKYKTSKKSKKVLSVTLKCKVTVAADDVLPISGGWQTAESPVISADEAKKITAAATAFDPNVTFTPVACLATQVVAGINHRVLGEYSNSSVNSVPMYAIFEFYEDLEGNWSVLDLDGTKSYSKSEVPVYKTNTGLDGGWQASQDVSLTKDEKAVFDKAMEGLVGVTYKPVAKVATQVVAGIKYCFVCESTTVTAEPVSGYSLVWVLAGADGKNQVLTGDEGIKTFSEANLK